MASAQSIERRRRRQVAVAIREAEVIDAMNREPMELSDGSRSSSTEDELEQSVQASNFHIGSNPSEHENDFFSSNSSESDIDSSLNRHSSSSSDDNESSFSDIETNDPIEKNIRQHLASWVVKSNVQQRKVNSLLKVLALDPHNSNLPKTCRTLVKTPREIDLIEMRPGFYYHFGLVKGINLAVKSSNQFSEGDNLDIFLNCDGLPLTKSTGDEFWIISCRIGNLKGGNSKPFCVGAYWGTSKPADSNEFLSSTVTELMPILTEGIVLHGKKIFVRNCAIICDAPARAFVKKIAYHCGYSSCPKCQVVGQYSILARSTRLHREPRGRVVFLDTDCLLRTNDSFRGQLDENHHTGISVFEDLNLDMVLDFPYDHLHLTALGVGRKLLCTWVQPSDFKLTPAKIRLLDGRIKIVQKYCPRDFARKQRSVLEVPRWKGTELNQFNCYTGMVVLEGIISNDQYQHFLLFSIALRILSSEEHCMVYNDYANNLLVTFSKSCPRIYEEAFVTHNVHGLIHLAQDVKRFGPLIEFSAFQFENYLQTVKNLVRKRGKPLTQFVKRTLEVETNLIPDLTLENERLYQLKQEHFTGPLVDGIGAVSQYRKCFMGKRHLTCLKNDVANCCVLLQSGDVVLIENFVLLDEKPFVVGKKFVDRNDLFISPLQSSSINIFKVKELDIEREIWPLESINKKCYRIPIASTDCFAILPLLTEGVVDAD